MKTIFFLTVMMLLPSIAQEQTEWRTEAGVVVSHFQQQIKRAVGDPRGQRLVNEFQIGGLVSAGYRVHDIVHLGFFVRIDRGERYLAMFDGFDAEGKTKTRDGIGGTYTEVWIGPLAQIQWKQVTLDVGFAPYGERSDRARGDIPNDRNSTDGAFSLHPTIAWLIALGGAFELTERIDLLIKVEYRPRYYSERGGSVLINDIEHGTQSVVPVAGISYAW